MEVNLMCLSRKYLAIPLTVFLTAGFYAPFFAHAAGTDTDPTDTSYASRYKLFIAEHESVTRSGKIDKVTSIFKIDLDTGTVWRYRQGVDQKGKPFEEFFEVPNQ
jgi:hypothetical protein